MKLHKGFKNRPINKNFVDCIITPLSEEEACFYLKNAWKNIYLEYPSEDSLALLWAQSCGETGRWKLLRNNNWGNIKNVNGVQYPEWDYTSYDAGEVLTIDGVTKHRMYYPYHPQTHFASWKTPLEGAEAYIRFVSQKKRYKRAWAALIRGDVIDYCIELKRAGYFTADLDHYTKGVIRLVNEFKSKYKELNNWEPEPIIEIKELDFWDKVKY